MRLINVSTRLLEEFFGNKIPEYAILSHTWEHDEISLPEYERLMRQGFLSLQKATETRKKAGFIKITQCIETAAKKGIPYVWIDTCCISKESSAELGEAINFMYRWYQRSKVCFAYLADVHDADQH